MGQLRRLLRLDRLCLIFKEYVGYLKKKRLSTFDRFMIVFRTMLLCEDIHDVIAFLIQLRVLKGEGRIQQLRKTVADFYFF